MICHLCDISNKLKYLAILSESMLYYWRLLFDENFRSNNDFLVLNNKPRWQVERREDGSWILKDLIPHCNIYSLHFAKMLITWGSISTSLCVLWKKIFILCWVFMPQKASKKDWHRAEVGLLQQGFPQSKLWPFTGT